MGEGEEEEGGGDEERVCCVDEVIFGYWVVFCLSCLVAWRISVLTISGWVWGSMMATNLRSLIVFQSYNISSQYPEHSSCRELIFLLKLIRSPTTIISASPHPPPHPPLVSPSPSSTHQPHTQSSTHIDTAR